MIEDGLLSGGVSTPNFLKKNNELLQKMKEITKQRAQNAPIFTEIIIFSLGAPLKN